MVVTYAVMGSDAPNASLTSTYNKIDVLPAAKVVSSALEVVLVHPALLALPCKMELVHPVAIAIHAASLSLALTAVVESFLQASNVFHALTVMTKQNA
jgi:hypothetical protein